MPFERRLLLKALLLLFNMFQQKEDVKFCREKGYSCTHISDLKEVVDGLFTDIENEIDLLPKEKKSKLTRDFEPMRKKCLSEVL